MDAFVYYGKFHGYTYNTSARIALNVVFGQKVFFSFYFETTCFLKTCVSFLFPLFAASFTSKGFISAPFSNYTWFVL